MEENTCGGCVCFFRHYIRDGRRYRPLPFGHCIYPRLKQRECGQKACGHFRSNKHYREGPEQLER